MSFDLPPELGKLVAAPLGAMTALIFMKEAWPRRLAMAAVSMPLAWYASPTLASVLHIPEGFAGWLLGTFGALAVRSIFEITWSATIEEWIRARLGLPARTKGNDNAAS